LHADFYRRDETDGRRPQSRSASPTRYTSRLQTTRPSASSRTRCDALPHRTRGAAARRRRPPARSSAALQRRVRRSAYTTCPYDAGCRRLGAARDALRCHPFLSASAFVAPRDPANQSSGLTARLVARAPGRAFLFEPLGAYARLRPSTLRAGSSAYRAGIDVGWQTPRPDSNDAARDDQIGSAPTPPGALSSKAMGRRLGAAACPHPLVMGRKPGGADRLLRARHGPDGTDRIKKKKGGRRGGRATAASPLRGGRRVPGSKRARSAR
jgi:hypothetical protein